MWTNFPCNVGVVVAWWILPFYIAYPPFLTSTFLISFLSFCLSVSLSDYTPSVSLPVWFFLLQINLMPMGQVFPKLWTDFVLQWSSVRIVGIRLIIIAAEFKISDVEIVSLSSKVFSLIIFSVFPKLAMCGVKKASYLSYSLQWRIQDFPDRGRQPKIPWRRLHPPLNPPLHCTVIVTCTYTSIGSKMKTRIKSVSTSARMSSSPSGLCLQIIVQITLKTVLLREH